MHSVPNFYQRGRLSRCLPRKRKPRTFAIPGSRASRARGLFHFCRVSRRARNFFSPRSRKKRVSSSGLERCPLSASKCTRVTDTLACHALTVGHFATPHASSTKRPRRTRVRSTFGSIFFIAILLDNESKSRIERLELISTAHRGPSRMFSSIADAVLADGNPDRALRSLFRATRGTHSLKLLFFLQTSNTRSERWMKAQRNRVGTFGVLAVDPFVHLRLFFRAFHQLPRPLCPLVELARDRSPSIEARAVPARAVRRTRSPCAARAF